MKNSWKWYARLSAIFLTYWGLETGWFAFKNSMNGYFSIWLIGLFLIKSLPLIIPAIPLWYYGFKKLK